jgi:hypothetical protein
MQSREELEGRIKDLEAKVAALSGGRAGGLRGGMLGVRRRAQWEIANLPFYDIALGPDFAKGEMRGHAKGFIAIGDIATGVLAIGGLSRGVFALGGFAVGLFSVGGFSLGALAAVGGLAIGSVAMGGGALGGIAIGGGAVGYYACGGGALGEHVVSATRNDPEVHRALAEYGIDGMCPAPRRYR